MTIEQFQKVYRLSEEKGLDEMDKAVQMVCVFTGNAVKAGRGHVNAEV